jgi:PDZ domain-containing protein
MTTVADPRSKSHAIVGISIEPAVDIHLPVPVRIDAGNVGGPSAGLAFALEVMEKFGVNVVRGHRVAATGEIFADGEVGPIGGIRQKTIGAHDTGVDAFLVPVGNAADARKAADGLRIIPVKTFAQALHALKTLPPAH